ncbi:MAG: aminotransferase class V-fold PLP-dependent enzyme [Defluviitaleaceae bacterium]|nr:aminotransferase class V-fold PLP-dependent enzyme [Defluviitaleaceae bacterium]
MHKYYAYGASELIYFDNAATTKPISSSRDFYNPSSPHGLGLSAQRTLREARNKVLAGIHKTLDYSGQNNIPEGDIIFTSGGTEANTLAIVGYSLAHSRQSLRIVTANYEHPSILSSVQFSCERGWAISVPLDNLPTDGAVLLSISQVGHETGDINDIRKIAQEIKDKNPSVVIHVDGAQGFCKELISLDGVDMYSFSGHKVHGPYGVGGLWVRKGVRLVPLQPGGGQEGGLRGGTENVSGIVQMAEAVENLAPALDDNRLHVAKIKSIVMGIIDDLPDVLVNSLGDTSPYLLNMSFLGVKGEVLVHALSAKGLYVSMGAACRSRSKAKSDLELMGFERQVAESAIRFSFSPYNTIPEAEIARGLITDEVNRFRKMRG